MKQRPPRRTSRTSRESIARIRAKLDTPEKLEAITGTTVPSATPPRSEVDHSFDRFELEKDVDVMRRLGVALWKRPGNEIALGPPPQDATPVQLSPEERHARAVAADHRRMEIMFAASSVRPRMPESRSLENVVPRGVTPSERDDGATKQ